MSDPKLHKEDVVGWCFTKQLYLPNHVYTCKFDESYLWGRNGMIRCFNTLEEALFYRCNHKNKYLTKFKLKGPELWVSDEEWGGQYVATKAEVLECYQADFSVIVGMGQIAWSVNSKARCLQKEFYQFLRDATSLLETPRNKITNEQRFRFKRDLDLINSQIEIQYESYKEMRDISLIDCIRWLFIQAWGFQYNQVMNNEQLAMKKPYNLFEEMVRLYNNTNGHHLNALETLCNRDFMVVNDVIYDCYLTKIYHKLDNKIKFPAKEAESRHMRDCDRSERDRFVPLNQIIKYEDRIYI